MIRPIRGALMLIGAVGLLTGCEAPPVESEQIGYRGVAMQTIVSPEAVAALKASNVVPAALPLADPGGPRASEVYQNVQVLGDLSAGEFGRLMAAITAWVSPEQGCAYCHAGDNLASDDVYTKVVSRRMLQMTRHLNTEWASHVGATGVTCYTCHRGKNVPEGIWFTAPDNGPSSSMMASNHGQNAAADSVALASLPYDPFSPLLTEPGQIRVIGDTALPPGDGTTIQATERTYGLMMHMSEALGVNCTHCHNSRSFNNWTESTPQRATAWHGIRLVRDINVNYLTPLQPVYPANRLGPTGDAPKAFCTTCHLGAAKPLLGVSMYKDYPELGAPRTPPEPPAEAAPEAAATDAAAATAAAGPVAPAAAS